MTADWTGAIERASAHSPFLSQAMESLPDLTAILAAGDGEQALNAAHAAGEGEEDIAVALRRERLALALVLAIGDLAGAFPLLKVTGELSDFADRSLDAAISDAIRRRAPDAEPAGFIGLALGKHGRGRIELQLGHRSDIAVRP